MVFWYGPVQSDKRLDRAVQSFQQSPKKATVRTGPDRGQSNCASRRTERNRLPRLPRLRAALETACEEEDDYKRDGEED